jgi:hypothetical protein
MTILQTIAAGGDLAIVAVLYLLWRLDRRVLKLETNLSHDRSRD